MSKTTKKPDITDENWTSYYKGRNAFSTVKMHFSQEAKHPDSLCRFTCAKHVGTHGTFWVAVRDAVDFEERGESACPMCRALARHETVDFATFKKQVADQRKVLEKAEKKSNRNRWKSAAGLNRYAS